MLLWLKQSDLQVATALPSSLAIPCCGSSLRTSNGIWADSPKLKGDLEQALHKLENSLNDFGQAMTTMEPEFVKKRFPNWQDLHEEFVSKTDKLVGSVNNEIRILTNMRLSREKL